MIYKNMSFDDYRKLPGLNASKLKPYSISPRHGYFKEKKNEEDKPRSQALSIGTLVHALVLEGQDAAEELIKSKYITSGFPINTKTNKPYGEDSQKYKLWLQDQDPNKSVINKIDLAIVRKIARAINSHSKSRWLLSLAPYRETAITWNCPFTGIPCKAMVDFYGGDFAADLKTFGKQLTFKSIEREMYERQYHLQFAFYRDGLKANGFNAEDFYVIFAQNKDDYDVGCFHVDELSLQQGQNDYLKAIKNYNIATEDKDEFKPGLFPEIATIGIPNYALEFDAPDADTLGVSFS
jgi:hypothetical protein